MGIDENKISRAKNVRDDSSPPSPAEADESEKAVKFAAVGKIWNSIKRGSKESIGSATKPSNQEEEEREEEQRSETYDINTEEGAKKQSFGSKIKNTFSSMVAKKDSSTLDKKSSQTEVERAPSLTSSRSSLSMNLSQFKSKYLAAFGDESEKMPAAMAYASASKQNVGPKKKLKGSFSGVFVPTCENMWGVLIFLRFYYIVGYAGIGQALFAVFLSFSVAFCTTVSLSATASSGGMVSQGGPYYMISRSLGPHIGATVGITYWLGIIFLTVLECLGAVESLLLAYPDIYFESCERILGSVVVIMLALVVYGGINVVTKMGVIFLFIVLFTLAVFYVGLFTAPVTDAAMANPYITGLSGDTFKTNWPSHYADGVTFGSVLAVFFPCFTGILSGANRADVLKDPPKNIRQGTFGAIIFSLFMYSSFMILWGMVAEYPYLQHGHDALKQLLENAGEQAGAELRRLAGGAKGEVVGDIAWNPFPNAAYLGIVLASISQALQCMVVAPRLIQSIARDDLIPILRNVAPLSKAGEPARGLLVSYIVAAGLVLIGSLDAVAPLLTMCFLVCYLCMNISCAVLTFLRSPSWRPDGMQHWQWRAWYMLTGVCGFILCIVVMFIVNAVAALAVLILTIFIYTYINYYGSKGDWGSGLDGIKFNLALAALHSYDRGHSKDTSINWRPQFLILYSIDVKAELEGDHKHREILSFYDHFHKGRGMCCVCAVLRGDKHDQNSIEFAKEERKLLDGVLHQERIQGFTSVTVSDSWAEGADYIVQLTGLGGMEPNTVMLGWPTHWDESRAQDYVRLLRLSLHTGKAVMAIKGLKSMPTKNEVCEGTMDIWWMIHDGGLLILLAWMLQQHKTWRPCKLRVFTITESISQETKEFAGQRLTQMLKKKRLLDVQVEIIVLEDEMIEPYTCDWSLRLEQRKTLMQALHNDGKTALPMELDDMFADPNEEASDAPKLRTILTSSLGLDKAKAAMSARRKSCREEIHPAFKDRVATWSAFKSSDKETEDSSRQNLHNHIHRRMSLTKTAMLKDEGSEITDEKVTEQSNLGEFSRRLSKNVKLSPDDIALLDIHEYHDTHQTDSEMFHSNDSIEETVHDADDEDSPRRDGTDLSKKTPTIPENEPVVQNGNILIEDLNVESEVSKETGSDDTHEQRKKNAEKLKELNKIVQQKSGGADIVIMNLPQVWGDSKEDAVEYLEYCESLTEGIDRVLFVHSTGEEVCDLSI